MRQISPATVTRKTAATAIFLYTAGRAMAAVLL